MCILLQVSVSAQMTSDVLLLYGNDVKAHADVKEEELLTAQEQYEDLMREVDYLNRFNAGIESVDIDSMNLAMINMAEDIKSKQVELLQGVDLSVNEILKLENDLSTLEAQYKVISEEVNYYNTLYTYDIPQDKIEEALALVDTKAAEYSEAVAYGEIGDVTGVKVPVDGPFYISSYFGGRINPLDGVSYDNHRGVDFAANLDTPIQALFSGTVVVADYHWGLGNYVRIDHGDGIVSTYLHLNSISTHVGQQVTQYDEIGKCGSTGAWSTGSHLHLALSINGVYVDPYKLFYR